MYIILFITLLILIVIRYCKVETFEDTNNQIAIVTTSRASHQLNDWINYHLKFGISKIYIIFDDPNEDISKYRRYDSRVNLILNNDIWKDSLKECSQYSKFKDTYKDEVMSRQILNAEMALKLAKQDNVKWLIHIDTDEILHSQNYNSISEVFSKINYAVNVVKIQNYELAPLEENVDNCFRSHSYFKTKNAGTMYNAYFNGKGGCKVIDKVYPNGVHDFKLNMNEVKDTISENDLVILHYVNCSYNEWVNKYKLLGKFSDKWWNKKMIPLKFHKISRDAITNNNIKFWENTCKQIYNNNVVINRDVIDGLINDNKITKITKVNDILNS